jgi:hypothetical protein
VSSSSTGGGLSLQVNKSSIDWNEALEVVRGYAFATVDLGWKDKPSFVGQAVAGQVPQWAYRTYDCMPAGKGCGLTDIDVLVPNAINARMGGKVIAGLRAISAQLSAEIAGLDELGLAFWEFDESDVVRRPADGDSARPLWRAWSIVSGIPGAGIAVTHKVLHHKRPSVFPLLDNKTSAALGGGGDAWLQIHRDLTATPDGWTELERAFANEAVGRDDVSLTRLRLHDILLWTDTVDQWDACRAAASGGSRPGAATPNRS